MCSLSALVTVCCAFLFLLKLLSLTMDGLTGVFQDHMRTRFQTSAYHMMLNINLWSTLVLGLGGTTPAVFGIQRGFSSALFGCIPTVPYTCTNQI